MFRFTDEGIIGALSRLSDITRMRGGSKGKEYMILVQAEGQQIRTSNNKDPARLTNS